jgi:hypothetical protein
LQRHYVSLITQNETLQKAGQIFHSTIENLFFLKSGITSNRNTHIRQTVTLNTDRSCASFYHPNLKFQNICTYKILQKFSLFFPVFPILVLLLRIQHTNIYLYERENIQFFHVGTLTSTKFSFSASVLIFYVETFYDFSYNGVPSTQLKRKVMAKKKPVQKFSPFSLSSPGKKSCLVCTFAVSSLCIVYPSSSRMKKIKSLRSRPHSVRNAHTQTPEQVDFSRDGNLCFSAKKKIGREKKVYDFSPLV